MMTDDRTAVNSGGIRRLWTRLTVNNVEETKMNPEFIELVERYDTYKQCCDALIDRLETCLQQNQEIIAKGKVEAEVGENPYEKLASSLSLFYTYLPTDRQPSIQAAILASRKLASLERDYQCDKKIEMTESQIEETGRFYASRSASRLAQTNRTPVPTTLKPPEQANIEVDAGFKPHPDYAIRFVEFFYFSVLTELFAETKLVSKPRQYLDCRTRDHMDRIKHEVKMSKTTEKIEKYAILYEQAVGDFDAQANRVLVVLNQLPAIKLTHEVIFTVRFYLHLNCNNRKGKRMLIGFKLKDLEEYWTCLQQFNAESAKVIANARIQ
ncbi:unnamed protein product [Toxocara canis]|uniref:BAR domain-containing protein n=1 Tax=Toxocara canis TaxID=6265 RepID=A0A183UC25_TOXCA|nr:unnamed protein product [Toxocara canis]